MEWLNKILFETGNVGHIVFIYALVIAIGYKLGKVKFGPVTLGSAFILFVGIIVGHIYNAAGIQHEGEAYLAPAAVLNFVQDFGLILFVYCIGLQVGPGFFSSFKKGGISLNLYSIAIVLLNVGITVLLYYLFCDTDKLSAFPMMVGVLCGAVTNTPALGAANETLTDIMNTNGALAADMGSQQIASAYACAYPLGVLGMIGAVILLRFLLKIRLENEQEQIRKEVEDNPHAKPHRMTLQLKNAALFGKPIVKVREFMGRNFVCSRLEHEGEIVIPKFDTTLNEDDYLNIVCAEDDADAIIAFLGPVVEKDLREEENTTPIISKRVVVTKENVDGKTFGQMHFSSLYGVNVTRITRSGMDLFADRNLHIQIGDRLLMVGPEDNVNRAAAAVGNSAKRLNHPNIGPIFIGILLGILFGSIPFTISGIPNPVKLGLAGGPLIIAILVGAKGYKLHLVSYTTTSVNLFVRELGLCLFLASVGIKAGAGFWNTLTQGDGIMYVWLGFIITVVPILIMGVLARTKLKLNYFTMMGFVAGTYTDPPLLGFANQIAGNDAPAVGYSTVYPLSMFMRILTAQLLILLWCAA